MLICGGRSRFRNQTLARPVPLLAPSLTAAAAPAVVEHRPIAGQMSDTRPDNLLCKNIHSYTVTQ